MTKSIFLACAAFFITLNVYPQQSYNLSFEENDPNKAFSKFIAPLFGYEISNNFDFYLGATGRWSFTEKFDVEGTAAFDIFQMNGEGPGLIFEGGIFLPFSRRETVKELPVPLEYNPFAGSGVKNGTHYRIETSKHIKVPGGIYLNQTGLHTGVYAKRVGAQGDGIKTSDASSIITHTGLYIGIQRTSQAHMKVKLDDYGIRIGAAFVRYYGDLIFLPISEVADPLIEAALKKNGKFGWRAGFQWYLDPHEGEYKRLGKTVLTAEIGQKPLTGFFINMTWGFAILNMK